MRKKKCDKYDFVYWKYDGGQIGSFLTKKYKGIKHLRDYKSPFLFKKKIKPNKHSKEIEKLAKREKGRIRDCIKLNLSIATTGYLSKCKKKKRSEMDRYYEEFTKMFSPEKGQEAKTFIARLLAVVLSSYFIRDAFNQKTVFNMYPLPSTSTALCVLIQNRVSDDAIYTLRMLCNSMMVSTVNKKSGGFKIKAPTVLPVDGKRELLADAWLRPKRLKTDFKWPAPYRDMAVMLDGRFFQKSDMKNFLLVNPWCTAVIYNSKIEHTHLCIKLNGNDVLDQMEIDWDTDAVNKLIAGYIPFVQGAFEKHSHKGAAQIRSYTDIWNEAGEYLNNYITTKKGREIGYAERFKQRILLSALLSFVDFISSSCNISPDDVQNLKRELLTALLPGCCPSKSEEEVQVIQFPAFDEILKELISLDNMKHFYPIIKRGQVHPTELSDGTEVWGYVRRYKDEKSQEKEINIAFFGDTLIKIVEEKYPQCGYFGNVLTCVIKSELAYLHKTHNIRCRTAEGKKQNTISGYRLILDKVPVSEEVKQAFRQMLPEKAK